MSDPIIVNNSGDMFLPREIAYLQEYTVVMQPLAVAIDVFQGHNHNYYGQVIPMLYSLREHYIEMSETGTHALVKFAAPKIIEALEGIKRFDAQFNLRETARLAIVASLSHPEYKLSWLEEGSPSYTKAYQIFSEEVDKIVQQKHQQLQSSTETQPPSGVPTPNTSRSSHHNFIPKLGPKNFIVRRSNPAAADTQGQILRFLEDPRTNISMLESYPEIKEIFWRSNTPLCSTAALERIFNFAGILNNPKRSVIAPNNFNMSIVLKGNQVYRRGELLRDAEGNE